MADVTDVCPVNKELTHPEITVLPHAAHQKMLSSIETVDCVTSEMDGSELTVFWILSDFVEK